MAATLPAAMRVPVPTAANVGHEMATEGAVGAHLARALLYVGSRHDCPRKPVMTPADMQTKPTEDPQRSKKDAMVPMTRRQRFAGSAAAIVGIVLVALPGVPSVVPAVYMSAFAAAIAVFSVVTGHRRRRL